MRYLLSIALCLFAVSSFAATPSFIGLSGLSIGGCTYSTDYTTPTGTSAGRGEFYNDTRSYGSSWAQVSTGSSPKISFHLAAKEGTPVNFRMRVGTSANLTTEYLQEVTFNVTSATGELQTVTFEGLVLTPGTYYWLVSGPVGGSYANRINISAVTLNGGWHETTTSGFNASPVPARSMRGTIESCK